MNTTNSKTAPPTSRTDEDAHLPHDRDEKPEATPENAQHDHNRETMRKAHADVESDIQDTERIGTPNDVPGSGDNR